MTAPLSVAVISHFPPPPGGMPGQAQLLVRNLGREGVTAIAVRTNLGAGRFAVWLDGVRGLRTLLRLPLYLLRVLAAAPRARVLHVFSHSGLGFFLFTVPAVLIGRLTGRRVVVNYHGGAAEDFVRAWPRLVPALLRLAHALTVPSGYLEAVFARHQVRATVVPNVCDLDRFDWHGDAELRPVFLVARHLEPVYNVACVIRAFARIRERRPGARLVVLGDGAERGRLRRLAAELGVARAVEFAGYVPYQQLPGRYREASIALNASHVDNMPVALLEAFAAGLPIVSTRAGGIPYLVEDGVTGFLVDLDDDATLAQRALALLDDPARARTIARNARAAARQYQWPEVYARLRAVYDGP